MTDNKKPDRNYSVAPSRNRIRPSRAIDMASNILIEFFFAVMRNDIILA